MPLRNVHIYLQYISSNMLNMETISAVTNIFIGINLTINRKRLFHKENRFQYHIHLCKVKPVGRPLKIQPPASAGILCGEDIQYGSLVREHGDAPFQYALHVCNQNPIIGYGQILILSAFQAVFHLPFIEHAAPAVNNQFIFRKILRKLST